MEPKCYAPYLGVFYRTNNNRVGPCCQYKTTVNPNEYDFQNVIKDLEQNTENENCSTCWEREKYGKTTLRHSFNNYRKSFAEDWDGKSFMPVYADVRTSNFCNLQCNMCSPLDSSKIESFIKQNPTAEKYFKSITSNYQNKDVNLPIADLAKLRVLKVAGGEPTIDPQCIKFLDDFVNQHDASNVELWLTTNATKMIPFLKNYKTKFKRLCVMLSIDATGPILEFIRYPAKWSVIEKNIDIAIKENLYDDLNVNIVVQPYNLLTIRNWIGYFSEFRKKVPRTKIVFLECSNPKHFSLKALTTKAKNFLLNEITELQDIYPNLEDKFSELIKMINKAKFDPQCQTTLIEYTDTISNIRNMNAWNIDTAFKYIK
jgi:sulfatase maturation enzyme AslB (radical SAM superfamily)